MIKCYYSDNLVEIYHGDCFEILPQLDVKADMLLTDPPYNISYQVIIHRSVNPERYKYKGKDIILDFGNWDKFDSQEHYLQFLNKFINIVNNNLKEKAHAIIFIDQNNTSYVIEYARAVNWHKRQHLYWLKTIPVPRARKVDFMIALEYAIWFTKGNRAKATFNYQLGQQANYVACAIPNGSDRYHPTQKPKQVIKTWINYLSNPNDIILDPFGGVGTTAVCAKELNRRCILIEKDEKYCEISAKRCYQQKMLL